MRKKVGLVFSSSLLFLPLASAQEAQGIIPLLTQLIGIEVGNPRVAIGVAASFGLMVALVYSVLKIGAEKLEMAESLMGGQYGEGRNILLIISVLIGLSTLGTGAFGTLVQSFGLISVVLILAIAFVAVFAVGSFGAFGAGGAAKFAGSAGEKLGAEGNELAADAKEKRAESKKRRAEADKKMREAEKEAERMLGEAEQDADDGHMEDAVKEFKDVMNLIEQVEPRLGDGFTEIEEELKDAKDELENVKSTEREDHQKFVDIGNRLKRIRQYLEVIYKGSGSQKPLVANYGDGDELNVGTTKAPASRSAHFSEDEWDSFLDGSLPTDNNSIGMDLKNGIDVEIPGEYGIDKARDDVERIENDINAINRNLDSLSGGLFDALREFDEAVDNAMRTSLLLKELAKVLNRVEGDTETLEEIERERSLNDLVDDTKALVNEENKAEKVKNELEDYADEIEEAVKQVIEPLEDELKRDETEIREAKEEIKLESEIENILTGLSEAMQTSRDLKDSGTDTANIESTGLDSDDLFKEDNKSAWYGHLNPLYSDLATVRSQLDSIESNLEDNDRRVVGEVKTILGDASENDEQIQIAEDIAEEMQRIYGESRYT